MKSKLTNITSNVSQINRVEIIEEFKGFIGGVGVKNTKDLASLVTTSILQQSSIDVGSASGVLLERDEKLHAIAVAGTSEGGYYVGDMMSGIAAPGIEENPEITLIGYGVVDKALQGTPTTYVTVEKTYTTKVEGEEKVNTIKSYGSKIASTTDVLKSEVNGPTEPDRYNNPTVGAIVLSNQFSIAKRNADEIALFFNAIPPVEMSRCVPYINMQVMYERDPDPGNDLSVVSSLKFIKNEAGKMVLDDKAGISNATNISSDTVNKFLNSDITKNFQPSDIINEGLRANVNTSGMELFLSPQTLSNGNIRQAVGGENILEPIMPLMSLDNFSVSIQGFAGRGLYSSKKADLKLVLHDRSRLRQIAPLVSPEQFGNTKIYVEFGWNHPEGSINSKNVVGKFLNGLKDVAVYNVVSSNISISGPTVNIDVSLAAGGANDAYTVSVGAGRYVPSAVFKPQLTNLISRLIEEETQAIPMGNQTNKKLREIRKKHKLSLNEAISTKGLIRRSEFAEIIDAAGLSTAGLRGRNIELFVSKLTALIKPETESSNAEGEEESLTDNGKTLTTAISEKIYALGRENSDPFSQLQSQQIDEFTERLKQKAEDGGAGLTDEDIDRLVTVDPESDGANFLEEMMQGSEKGSVATLGKILLSFVAHAYASIAKHDEVQMVFYPINHLAAGAHIYSTATFPIPIPEFQEKLREEISEDPNISVAKFMRFLDDNFIGDVTNRVYLLQNEQVELKKLRDVNPQSDAFNELNAAIPAPAEGEELATVDSAKLTALSKQKKKDNQAAIEAQQTEIDGKLITIYNGGSKETFKGEPKFLPPDINFHFESIPVIQPAGTSDAEYQNKTMLRIHVFDRASTPYQKEHFLQSMITSNDIPTKIETGAPDDKGSIEVDELLNNLTAQQIKDVIKSKVPSITYGSSASLVNSFSMSSATGGSVANTLLVTANLNRKAPGTGFKKQNESVIEDMTMIPSTCNMTCLGMPLLHRGDQLYIDAKTGTTLDNLYAIKSVTHTIAGGRFESSVGLQFLAQNGIESMKGKIRASLEKLRNIDNNELQISKSTDAVSKLTTTSS